MSSPAKPITSRLDDLVGEVLRILGIDRAKVPQMVENQLKTAIAQYILEEQK